MGAFSVCLGILGQFSKSKNMVSMTVPLNHVPHCNQPCRFYCMCFQHLYLRKMMFVMFPHLHSSNMASPESLIAHIDVWSDSEEGIRNSWALFGKYSFGRRRC